jgi:hypothetical protein
VPLSLACALASLALGACSKPKSYVVLGLRSADTRVIAPVTKVVVDVEQPTSSLSKTLSYTTSDPLVIDTTNTHNDLSVSFTGGRSGPVGLSVQVFDDTGCLLARRDDVSVTIREGDTVSTLVFLEVVSNCQSADGGADGPEAGVIFPGCDPVEPQAMCAGGQTCQVDCTLMKGECTAGGTGGPGQPCTTNKDCQPGSQCFDYSGTGCAVKVCLRFCNDDAHCGPAGGNSGGSPDAGADASAPPSGPRSVCEGIVPCGQVVTGYHTCTFGCDPRQAAIQAGQTGCPSGLACLVVGSMDQVDCACPGASRTGADGSPCTGGADCAPGYLCNTMEGAQRCRAVCRCDAKNMTCTAANECAGGKTCSALTNETTFGVCL